MDKGRVLAITDGVVAIAATIMVRELSIPEGLTLETLGGQWPTFFRNDPGVCFNKNRSSSAQRLKRSGLLHLAYCAFSRRASPDKIKNLTHRCGGTRDDRRFCYRVFCGRKRKRCFVTGVESSVGAAFSSGAVRRSVQISSAVRKPELTAQAKEENSGP